MNFRTEIQTNPSSNRISHQTPVMLIGSCFTDNIGRKLKELCFPVDINPCGIIYNPLSIIRSMELVMSGKDFPEEELGYFNELWFSFDHHTSFSHPDKAVCLEKINSRLRESRTFLTSAKYIFITFGTSRIYLHKNQRRVVSNCHKIPAEEFERKIMSVDEIAGLTQDMMNNITRVNPSASYIFTISPVRHWKDGAVGNQINKAGLVLAMNNLVEQNPGKAEYFPAYEIMLDDLRDYRFYADDLLHPGSMATQYIWEKFSQTFFDEQTLSLNNELLSLNNAMNHRPLNKDAKAWKKFLQAQKMKMENLANRYPYLNLKKFEEYFL